MCLYLQFVIIWCLYLHAHDYLGACKVAYNFETITTSCKSYNNSQHTRLHSNPTPPQRSRSTHHARETILKFSSKFMSARLWLWNWNDTLFSCLHNKLAWCMCVHFWAGLAEYMCSSWTAVRNTYTCSPLRSLSVTTWSIEFEFITISTWEKKKRYGSVLVSWKLRYVWC